jgi:hypothetical protein
MLLSSLKRLNPYFFPNNVSPTSPTFTILANYTKLPICQQHSSHDTTPNMITIIYNRSPKKVQHQISRKIILTLAYTFTPIIPLEYKPTPANSKSIYAMYIHVYKSFATRALSHAKQIIGSSCHNSSHLKTLTNFFIF